MTIQTIFEFAVALVSLIIIHEIGHFLACRLFHVEVEEFGLGLPSPKPIVLFEAGGTKFTFNWLLLGGFVRPKGENDPNVEGGLAAASPWVRIAVFLAGPLMNLLVGVLLYAMIFTRFGSAEPILNQVQIMVPTGREDIDSPANVAGLQNCDIITSANGQAITDTDTIRDILYANRGKQVDLGFLRDSETLTTTLIPRTDESLPPAGMLLGSSYQFTSMPVTSVITRSVSSVYQYGKALFTLPGKLIRKEISGDEGRLVGFKGMYDIYSSMRTGEGTYGGCLPSSINVMSFFAAITISLGLMNLLPIPAVDGGQILFTLPEILFRKRIPPQYAGMINAIFLLLLIGLLLWVNLQDFINPIGR